MVEITSEEQNKIKRMKRAEDSLRDLWYHLQKKSLMESCCLDQLHPGIGGPGGSVLKNPPANAGDAGSIPGSRRSPGGGNSNPLQYSCLGNPTDSGAWWARVHRMAKNQTRLSD